MSIPKRRPAFAVAAALPILGLALAGCGGSSQAESPVAAMHQWVAQLSGGYDAQWATMVPAQQAKIPRATFELCNDEAYVGTNVGDSPPPADYLATVTVRQESLSLPGAAATSRSPATLVSAKIKVGKVRQTITLTWFHLDGQWRWALSSAAVAAYLGPSCPSVEATASPYLASPTTLPGSSTTTAPLVAPGNVRVQALNGLLVGPLAGDLNVKLKADGYQVLSAANATAKVSGTSIYVLTSGFVPEADVLAGKLGLPASVVVGTTPPPAKAPIPNHVLGHADLVVVIGPDLATTLESG